MPDLNQSINWDQENPFLDRPRGKDLPPLDNRARAEMEARLDRLAAVRSLEPTGAELQEEAAKYARRFHTTLPSR